MKEKYFHTENNVCECYLYFTVFNCSNKIQKSTFSSCVFFPSLHRNQTGSAEISEICAANHEAGSDDV